jgi:hypothetical protein
MEIFNKREGFATNSSSMHSIISILKFKNEELLEKWSTSIEVQPYNMHSGDDKIECPNCGAESMDDEPIRISTAIPSSEANSSCRDDDGQYRQEMNVGEFAKMKCVDFGDGCEEFFYVWKSAPDKFVVLEECPGDLVELYGRSSK